MVKIVLVACAPDDRSLWRHADYTDFPFMLGLPYLAPINFAAECWGLALTVTAIVPLILKLMALRRLRLLAISSFL